MIGPYKEDGCINMWLWPQGILVNVAMAAVVAMEIDIDGRASNGVVSVYFAPRHVSPHITYTHMPHSHSRPSLEISCLSIKFSPATTSFQDRGKTTKCWL